MRFRRAIGWIRRIGKAAGLTAAAAVLALVVAAFWIDWPKALAERYPGGGVVRDAAGTVIRVTLGPGDVDCRPYYRAEEADWVVRAVVASEDGTFFSHCGVRPLSILRALFQNCFYRKRISGASTITMQAVRLMAPHPKTYWWKYREAVMALKLERDRGKLEILSQYLNRAPFGSNLVGVEAAAEGWFGKSAKALGLGEAAMLAGILQSPTRFRPDRHLDLALKRRDYVLGRMLELGAIDRDQYEAAKGVVPEIRRAPRPFAAPHYCDWVLAGKTGVGELVTPLDPEVQSVCEAAVKEAADRGGYHAAAVVLRVTDGEVVAMAVSGDYFEAGDGRFNTALAPRPAGSVLKPFLAAQAMDLALATPATMLEDRPKEYAGYRPANFDGRYRGEVSLADALVLSLNLPFVNLLERVGVERFGLALTALGFAEIHEPYARYGLGFAIGNAEVTLLELVRAYGTLARGGDGVFSEASSQAVFEMLSGPQRAAAALGHIADVELPRYAWKTGTSSAYRDAWTVAWNGRYVVGVWCGHLRGGFGDTTLVGAKAAAPVAWAIVRGIE